MKAPASLWIVGILSLIWNAGGVYDFVMTKSEITAYLAALPAEQIAYLKNLPVWTNLAWIFGVFGGLAGSVLLLLRSRLAAIAYLLSFAGIVANLIYGMVLSDYSMFDVGGTLAMVFTLAIVLIAIFLWIYARRMRRAGVLR